MRVALVSPYSYTYPGGVGRHAEALAHEFLRRGHDVRLLAPYDPDDRLARAAHGGAAPDRRPPPEFLVPLGRTVGIPANGAVSNLALSSGAVAAVGRELRHGGYDVVHVHEPNVPAVSWYATEAARVPLVGTFHTYSTSRIANGLAANVCGARRLYQKLGVRIAVSEAARWTAERFYGGHYRLVPNGVDLDAVPLAPKPPHDEVRLLFVGRAEERKGLAMLLRAFEALRGSGVPATLTVAGATAQEVEPLLLEREGVEIAGRVSEAEKCRLLGEADLLCAPSLGGESFGMVLTEALAAGTPVVCSDIAGYRDVVRDGVDGLLVPPGRADLLGEALRGLAADPARRARLAAAAPEGAARFAWPRVADEVLTAYADAAAVPAPAQRLERAGRRLGVVPSDGAPRRRPQRLPPPEAAEPGPARRRRGARTLRRAGAAAGLAAIAAGGTFAVDRIGADAIASALLSAAPLWVLTAFALMCTSLLMRAEAWHAILTAALPGLPSRRRDVARATMIGVVMSATLPARLGEPSRALVVARRLGRVRERLPLVLGTIVSQTMLNILALVVLGTIMLATVGLFQGNEEQLVLFTVGPLVLVLVVLGAPVLVQRARGLDSPWARRAIALARAGLVQVRRGLSIFRSPRLAARAVVAQLGAWAVQWMACYVLLVALGLNGEAGIGAAAAVLFAVNVSAVLPALPSNLGVFQAACVAVLAVYGVGQTDALAYGIVLQALEIATALALGMPALLREGLSWRDMRVRALNAAPVELRGGSGRPAETRA